MRTSAPCCAIWRLCPEGTRRGISWRSQKPSMQKLSRRDLVSGSRFRPTGPKGRTARHLEALSGCRLQEVRAEFDGIVLYYTIALGVRAGDPLIAYGHP